MEVRVPAVAAHLRRRRFRPPSRTFSISPPKLVNCAGELEMHSNLALTSGIARDRVFVPDRPSAVIERHLVRNFSGRGPRLLLLHGPPGEGKSLGLRQVLRDAGVAPYFIHAGELENSTAGVPARRIISVIRKAGRINRRAALAGVQKHAAPVAVVLEDIDLGMGAVGALVQTTVNTQHVLGTLMQVCDDPGCRVPVILTANRPDALHGPLIRSGRAELFSWVLCPRERQEVLAHIFPSLKGPEIRELRDTFRGETVAFFADLAQSVREQDEATMIGQVTAREAVAWALRGEWTIPDRPLCLAELLAVGENLKSSRELRRWSTITWRIGAAWIDWPHDSCKHTCCASGEV
jgi:hypothetical protein